MRRTTRHLLAPSLVCGIFMATYLLVRPYGDAGSPSETATAFASTAWVLAHICGGLALASVGWLALRLHDLNSDPTTRIARWSGLAGVVLVLPYYGAETFGLHAVGHLALTNPATLAVTGDIRNQPAALFMFGMGLLLLTATGTSIGVAASRSLHLRPNWAGWPLALMIAAFPAQFFVPPAGRIVFGIVYALSAVLFAGSLSLRRFPRASSNRAATSTGA